MTHRFVVWFLGLFLCSLVSAQQLKFDDYFVDKTLRIDYYHVGSRLQEVVIVDKIYQQGTWAGNPAKLIYPFTYGRYFIKVYDVASNALIYSKGYDGYFAEYKTTDPARAGAQRAFHQSALIPFPKRPVLFVIEARDTINIYHPTFELRIDPADYHVITETPQRGDQVFEVVKNGEPHKKVDIVVLSEGYVVGEKKKFEADLKKYAEIFFGWEPYMSYKSRFNFTGIFSPSPESGVDEPRQGRYQHTLLDATFNSMDSDRYLLTENNKTMRDVAAQVPYDAILIMVNSKRYGGGALFGCFSTFTSDGPWSDYVFHHEFAHAFAFLADEYYASDVAYSEFFPQGIEPTEPNLTALLDPRNLKWRDLVSPGLAIPTPWGQERFDSLNVAAGALGNERRSKLEKMKKEGASEKEIQDVGKEVRQPKRKTPERNPQIHGGASAQRESRGVSRRGLCVERILPPDGQFPDVSIQQGRQVVLQGKRASNRSCHQLLQRRMKSRVGVSAWHKGCDTSHLWRICR